MVLPCLTTFAGSGQNEVTLPRYYGGYGGGSTDVDQVSFFTNVDLIYASRQKQVAGIDVKGGGIGVIAEAGAKVPVKIGRGGGRVNTFLSFSLAYTYYTVQEKYTDALSVEHKKDVTFAHVGLPVSLTGIHNGNGAVGFYWQAGCTINYLAGMPGDAKSDTYNRLSLFPFASLGVAFDRDVKRGIFRDRVSKSMIGPYISYCVTNMAGASNASQHDMIIGLHFTGVLLGGR